MSLRQVGWVNGLIAHREKLQLINIFMHKYLLKADISERGNGWKDIEISKAFDTGSRTTGTTKIGRAWFGCSYQSSQAEQEKIGC